MNLAKIKLWSKRILQGVVVLLACLFVFRYCGGCDNNIEVKKSNNDSLFLVMRYDSLLSVKLMETSYQDSLNTLASKHKEDSLKTLIVKFEGLYRKSSKAVREQIAEGICDTNLVKIALNDCDSSNVSKDRLIAQKDTTIERLETELEDTKQDLAVNKGMVVFARTIIKNQADDYKELEKESKKALRKQKIKTIGVIILATLTEVLTIFALK